MTNPLLTSTNHTLFESKAIKQIFPKITSRWSKRMTHKHLLTAAALAVAALVLGQPNQTLAQQGGSAKLGQIKQAFPGYQLTEADLGRFKSLQIDLNGDGKKEMVFVENPNMKASNAPAPKVAGGKMCLCKAKKPKGKSLRVWRRLRRKRKLRKALYNVERVKVKRRRYKLNVWYSSKKAAPWKADKWAANACSQLGRLYRRLRRYRIRNIFFMDTDTGNTHRISISQCRTVYRNRRRKKRMLSRFKRWRKEQDDTKAPMCPCPTKKKKKTRKPLPKASRPLNIVVATQGKAPTALPGQPSGTTTLSAATLLPKLKVIGRLRGSSINFTPLTQDGKIIGIRIEQSVQLGRRSPRITTETLYVYDEGNSGRLKQVFRIKTGRENIPGEPGARQWVDLKFRQMDRDDWLEITADAYYETPQFNGLVARRMFKWKQGKYVPLNAYRNILRARSQSQWKRIAPRARRTLQTRLQLRTSPGNVIDGFRDTPWVSSRGKRSIGAWIRVDFTRTLPVLGVAIAAQPSRLFSYTLPRLFSGRKPKLTTPRYLMINTSSGFKQTAAMRPGGGFTFIKFPTPVQTRYLRIAIHNEHRAPGQGAKRIVVPPKEYSIGMISEIVPIFDQIRYASSSFSLQGGVPKVARNAGDHRISTAWAEGRKDDGLGEWLQMIFPMPRMLNRIRIVNGCHNSGERYVLNNRVKEAQLTFSNGSTQTITLKDHHKTQTINIRPVRTMSVKLTIRSIYKGKVGHTTCLAELRP
jgi:hypothetical protein